MAEFPYSAKPSSLPGFLAKIQAVGIPDKVTLNYMADLGFKSSNDRYIPGILKSLGFADQSGVPTERWQTYRDKKRAPLELAAAIREAYSGLFDVYSDAYLKDAEALTNFFTSSTTVGEHAVSYMVRTFTTLCKLADFTSIPPSSPEIKLTTAAIAPAEEEESSVKIVDRAIAPQGITINVNIQLTLPETKDGSIYDEIFESLRKHLLA